MSLSRCVSAALGWLSRHPSVCRWVYTLAFLSGAVAGLLFSRAMR